MWNIAQEKYRFQQSETKIKIMKDYKVIYEAW